MEQFGPNDLGPEKTQEERLQELLQERGQHPQQFGPYVVLEQIGSGGMGAVYRARDRRLQRDVAIKALHRHLAVSGAQERFLREARAVSSLNHPNICTVFDIGEEGTDPYLVMELLEGVSLRDRLLDGPPFGEAELVKIAEQSALALAAAHAKGIVHRDIKPANLFLVQNPAETQLKVLDFGLAKLESDRLLYGDAGLTRTGSTVGTVEYMSPEQARGQELDPRSDLFSLGAVLYELATGDVPFRGPTSAVIFAELLHAEPVPPRSHNTSLSAGMDAIIRGLLEKNLEKRTQSAGDLLAKLKTLQQPTFSRTPILTKPRPVVDRPTASPAVPTPQASQPEPEMPVQPIAQLPAAPKHTVPVTDPEARPQRVRPDSAATSAGRRVARSEVRPAAAPMEEFRKPGDTADNDEVEPAKLQRWLVVAGTIVVAAVLGAAAYAWHRQHMPVNVGDPKDTSLQVSAFRNNTGDTAIDDVPATAMQLLLSEMRTLHLASYAPSLNATEPSGKALATASGADTYLTGEVSKSGQQYTVKAQIVRTGDGTTLAEEEVEAASPVELPGALSRLALALRTHLGETPEQANNDTVALATEASASIPALRLYGQGVALLRQGQAIAAVESFNKALVEDPVFPAARLRLAEALRETGAEPERLAAIASLSDESGSVCERANTSYEHATATAALDAAQYWATQCPQSADAAVALAREQLAAGRASDAEGTGSHAAALDPASHAAQAIATEAMLAQDHYELAVKQQQRAMGLQSSSPGLLLLSAYLRGDHVTEAEAHGLTEQSQNFDDQWNYITYLGDQGKLKEAQAAADATAARLAANPALPSAATVLRARMAVMMAMAQHCSVLPPAAADSNRAAYFASMANAWCHRAVMDASMPEPALAAMARAAQDWGGGHAADALPLLASAKQSAQAPVAALLRGEVHLQLQQQDQSIGDFRAVLTHRGAALLSGTLAYPAAQAGLAAAYLTTGDQQNSTRAASDLQTLWKDADPSEPLLHRARR